MTGLFAPESKSAEFFGFFAMAGQSLAFVGPVTFGLLTAWLAGYFQKSGLDALQAEQTGTRAGLLVIVLFLVVGLVILLAVNEKRARQVAEEYTPASD
jgi:UMF1 family MFS transporter